MSKALKMGIVGHGFVGKATDYGFSRNVEKFIVDPRHNTTIEQMESFKPDVVFVAVPTPMGSDGSIDDSILRDSIVRLNKYSVKPIVIIKSTVVPAVLKDLAEVYTRLVYNPEFLTERNAEHDFVNSDMIVLGGNYQDLAFVEKIYKENSIVRNCPVYKTDMYGASMVKYTMNCFLALKVGFFNQVKSVFDESGTEMGWDFFTKVVSTDPRIGETHMAVPGPDGRLGWGGACFQKDTNAMVHYTDHMTILEKAIEENNKIRSQYNTLDPREAEQGVSFKVIK